MTHNLDVTVDVNNSEVMVSDPKHHINSGDKVSWKITLIPAGVAIDFLEIELDKGSFTGTASIDATVTAAGHNAYDQLPYVFFLQKDGLKTKLRVIDLITPLTPTATDPCLVLDTSGPAPNGGGTGHCPHGPKGPSGRGGETPDCP
jgi:hypothetical protein